MEHRKNQLRTVGSLIGTALFGSAKDLRDTGEAMLQDVQGQVRTRRELGEERRRPLNAPPAPGAPTTPPAPAKASTGRPRPTATPARTALAEVIPDAEFDEEERRR